MKKNRITLTMINTKSSVIFLIAFFVTFCFLNANAQDEATSKGNTSVLVRWTVDENAKRSILCKPEGNTSPNLAWFINDYLPLPSGESVDDRIKFVKEPDGSISLEFIGVSYDIINAFGTIQKGVAEYTCVATGTNRPTNYTRFFISVEEYRSGGTVALAVFLLLLFVAVATLMFWKLQFNQKSIECVPM